MSNPPDGTGAGFDRPPPFLTVVVMGYRNEQTIVSSVRSVLNQQASQPFDVVIVTSGGDSTGDLVRRAFPDLPVFESPTRLLPGGARNAGTEHSSGQHVAFLAADCLAEPGWVEARSSGHLAGFAAVAGSMTSEQRHQPWALASHFLNYRGRMPQQERRIVAWPDPAAHSLSVEREVIRALGGFDPTKLVGEDTAFAERLAQQDIRILFEPEVRTAHRGPSGTRALLTDQYRRGARFVRENGVHRPGNGSTWSAITSEFARFTKVVRMSVGMARRDRTWSMLVSLPWIVVGDLALRVGRWRAFSNDESR